MPPEGVRTSGWGFPQPTGRLKETSTCARSIGALSVPLVGTQRLACVGWPAVEKLEAKALVASLAWATSTPSAESAPVVTSIL